MKIGIIVHSNTGNTFSVAEKLKGKLVSGGDSVEIRKIEPVGGENINEADINKISFHPAPDVTGYDLLIFCGPVRAFSISPVLSAYLHQIKTLKAQKVELFVTQQLAYPWLGGNRAISQMKKLCEEKGAIVGNTGIVNWKSKKKDQLVNDIVNKLGNK